MFLDFSLVNGRTCLLQELCSNERLVYFKIQFNITLILLTFIPSKGYLRRTDCVCYR